MHAQAPGLFPEAPERTFILENLAAYLSDSRQHVWLQKQGVLLQHWIWGACVGATGPLHVTGRQVAAGVPCRVPQAVCGEEYMLRRGLLICSALIYV